MAFIVGQTMNATDIRDAGGPWPGDSETKEQYYNRVLDWCSDVGIDAELDADGYPVYLGGYNPNMPGSGKGGSSLASKLLLGIGTLGLVTAVVVGSKKHRR